MRCGLALLTCVIALTGCGEKTTPSDPASTSPPATVAEEADVVPAADYVDAADELCAQLAHDQVEIRYEERAKEIRAAGGTDEEVLRRALPLFHDQVALVSEFRRKLVALGLPDRHADDVELMQEKTAQAEEAMQAGIAAIEAGNPPEASKQLVRYGGLAAQSASIARDSQLGFALCGAGG